MPESNDNKVFELRPKEGHMFITLLDDLPDSIGGIVIPKVAQGNRRFVGICKRTNPFIPGKWYQLWIKNRRVMSNTVAALNDLMRDIVGKKIVAERGRAFFRDGVEYADIRFEHVAMILDPDSKIDLKEDGIERCRWCPTKGEGNMLLDNKGYCIQCGRNSKGERRDPHADRKVSRQDVENFGFTQDEYRRMQDPKRKRESSRGMSYSGQKHRDNTGEVAKNPINEDRV